MTGQILLNDAIRESDRDFRKKHSKNEFNTVVFDREGRWYCQDMLSARRKHAEVKRAKGLEEQEGVVICGEEVEIHV